MFSTHHVRRGDRIKSLISSICEIFFKARAERGRTSVGLHSRFALRAHIGETGATNFGHVPCCALLKRRHADCLKACLVGFFNSIRQSPFTKIALPKEISDRRPQQGNDGIWSVGSRRLCRKRAKNDACCDYCILHKEAPDEAPPRRRHRKDVMLKGLSMIPIEVFGVANCPSVKTATITLKNLKTG